ncbi:MAG: hypothetical protein H0U76_04090 [Ktedonobacteraceae bacterium]|nr:hypothetical protein [Ktedonobacteraceae bacterium]
MSRKRQLTARQQQYANDIIRTEIAAREEVEAAFQERSPENDAKIATWGTALTQKRKDIQQASLKRRRKEACAYPGCTNIIEVGRTSLYEPEMPRPTRTVTITMQVEGWHWKGFSKEPNRVTVEKHFYGCCPEHEKGIYRLDFTLAIAPSLLEEKDLSQHIQYPMSAETQWKVYELARARAQELVAQAQQTADLPHIRRTITPLAEQEVEALIAASDPAWLTDNVERFRALYVQEFAEGYLESLRTRERAKKSRSRRYVLG